ncbi:class Ib ribonucleoside-diphosphate reductase assembly flavoprotein NrdI [Paracoccus suum]|uniref:Protein NrdI n=1 Tax=Paracoccus suum TaxID=2259340 RepID=A0A344PLW1_9RHOB|nr:class Ib ribonucleoside-diphosphate reductase assembly flavoprotein NrdI [Paracoccus suum]AXC50366.1 class Ib ribonucleoside-diphosphate reductase assembly flavoprotein NrdI [Paracoccus suum]
MAGVWYFSSRSGNTRRFVEALGMPAHRIGREGADTPDGPYVLICPTYGDGEGRGAVPKPVIQFLNDPQNRIRLAGVIGAGNRSFGSSFAQAADVIAEKCKVPLLYKFELAGTETDLARVDAGLKRLWGNECLTTA